MMVYGRVLSTRVRRGSTWRVGWGVVWRANGRVGVAWSSRSGRVVGWRVRGAIVRAARVGGSVGWRIGGGEPSGVRSGVSGVSSRSGSVVKRRSGPRVAWSGQRVETSPGRVAGGHLAVERSEARVVKVRGDSETVGCGVRRDVAGLERLHEDLKRTLESFSLVGGQGNNLGPAKANLKHDLFMIRM